MFSKLKSLILISCFLLGAGGYFVCYSFNHEVQNACAIGPSSALMRQYKSSYLTLAVPEGWYVRKDAVSGNEILESVSLQEKKNLGNGLVQVWQVDKSLESFVQESCYSPAVKDAIDELTVKSSQFGENRGLMVSYKRNEARGKIVCKEFFFARNKIIYRVGIFINKDKWNENDQRIFEQLVRDIKPVGV